MKQFYAKYETLLFSFQSWAFNIGHAALFLTYLFRCYRLIIIFNIELDKFNKNQHFYLKRKYRAKESYLLSRLFIILLIMYVIMMVLSCRLGKCRLDSCWILTYTWIMCVIMTVLSCRLGKCR